MNQCIINILLVNCHLSYVREQTEKVFIFHEPLTFICTRKESTSPKQQGSHFFSLSKITTKFKFLLEPNKPLKQLIRAPYFKIKKYEYIIMDEDYSLLENKTCIYTVQEKSEKLNFQFSEPEFSYLFPRNFFAEKIKVVKGNLYDRRICSCFLKKKIIENKSVPCSNYSKMGDDEANHGMGASQINKTENKLFLTNFLTNETHKSQIYFFTYNLINQISLFCLQLGNIKNFNKLNCQNRRLKPNITWLGLRKDLIQVNSMEIRFESPFQSKETRINTGITTELTSDTTEGQKSLTFFHSHHRCREGCEYGNVVETGFLYALGETKRLITLYRKNENSKKALEVFFKIKNVGRIFKEPKYIQNTTSSPGRRSGFLCWILGVVSAFFFLTFLFLRVHVSEKTRKGLSKKLKKSSNLSKRPIRKLLPSSAHGLKSKSALFCFGLFSKREKAETIELKPNEKSDAPKHKDIDSDIKRLVSFLEEHLAKKKIDYNKKPRTYWEKSQKKLSWMEEGLFYKLGISETLVLKSQEEGHTVKFDENGPYIFYKPPVEKTHVRDYNFYNLLKAYLNGDKANMFRSDFDLSYYFDICNGLRIIIIQMVRYIKEDFPSEKKDASDATPLLGCSQHRNELFTSLENFLDHLWAKEFEFIENYVYSSDKARRRLALFMTEANLTLINTLESKHGLRKPKMFIKLLQWFKKLKRTVKI